MLGGRLFHLVVGTLLAIIPPFAAAAADRQVQGPRRLVATLRGAPGSAANPQFSRDGQRLFVLGHNEVRVWDATTFQLLVGPLVHDGLATAKLASDGKVLLTVGVDARVWDVGAGALIGEPIRVPPVPEKDDEQSCELAGWAFSEVTWPSPAMPAALSRDGSRVAVTKILRHDGERARWLVEVWDVAPRRRVLTLWHDLRPAFVEFSSDGKRLLTAEPFHHLPHAGGENFHLWDLQTGAEVCPLIRTMYNYVAPEFQPAAFSPDGRMVAIASRTGFALHGARNGQWFAGPRPAPEESWAWERNDVGDVRSLRFSADGRHILEQNERGFRVWDAARTHASAEHLGWNPTFTAGGDRVIAGQVVEPERQRWHAVVWDVATDQQVDEYDVGESWPDSFSPVGHRYAVGEGRDGETEVWEVDATGGS